MKGSIVSLSDNIKLVKIDHIDAEFESYGFLYSQKKQTSLPSMYISK